MEYIGMSISNFIPCHIQQFELEFEVRSIIVENINMGKECVLVVQQLPWSRHSTVIPLSYSCGLWCGVGVMYEEDDRVLDTALILPV
jgi:hypothetical protein